MRYSMPLLAILVTTAAGAQETRQLGAHQHGHAKLEIAIEGDVVQIGLDAPGADIVGFEHAPNTPAETAAMDAAKRQLSDPLALFVPPAAAGCKVTSAEVSLEGDDDPKKGPAANAEPKPDAGHADFNADYTLTCTDITKLTTLDMKFFTTFKAAQALTVSILSATGQTEIEVTRDKPLLTLPAAK
jgi:Protein of unknown function (DUF2796)